MPSPPHYSNVHDLSTPGLCKTLPNITDHKHLDCRPEMEPSVLYSKAGRSLSVPKWAMKHVVVMRNPTGSL
jgi:hypothetical protein